MTDTLELRQLIRPGFMDDGERWRSRLTEVTHGSRDRRDVDQQALREWVREAWGIQPEIEAVRSTIAEGSSARDALRVVRLRRWHAEGDSDVAPPEE